MVSAMSIFARVPCFLLHEGSFSMVREGDDCLRFVTAEGRTIPRHGYRREDFVDDDTGGDAEDANENPSAEGFCTTTVQEGGERAEVRENRAIYRLEMRTRS